MIKSTAAYWAAISAAERRIYLRARVDLTDPDLVMGAATASAGAPWSRPEQLADREIDTAGRYATLERGRWLLDGTMRLIPADPADLTGQVGAVGAALSGTDGTFSDPPWAQIAFSGVAQMQAVSLYFGGEDADGWPTDFVVEIDHAGGTETRTVTGNGGQTVILEGLSLSKPTRIRVTVSRWSLPYRRFRAVEIAPGALEFWGNRNVASLAVEQKADISCLTLPYGTCTLALDNSKRRFEPRDPSSLFSAIQERQDVTIMLGVQLPDGSVEYKPVGVYYQFRDGWKTSTNDLKITWQLADIVGLLCDRTFVPAKNEEDLPTTLSGWIAAVVAHLGDTFAARYHVDPNYADLPVTARSVDAVTDRSCGDIIRWACQVTGTWPRADSETGDLTIEPLWSEGNRVKLTQLTDYPAMQSNTDTSMLIFKIPDESSATGEGTYIVYGPHASSEESVTINNPFIHDLAGAKAAAKLILSTRGGYQYQITGRGDPASEIGDVDTLWLDRSHAATARRIRQTLSMDGGVLQGCQATLLRADGGLQYEDRYLITVQEGTLLPDAGEFTVPNGVTSLSVALGQGGQGGGHGDPGYITRSGNLGNQLSSGYGDPGENGSGGKVWVGTIEVEGGQKIAYSTGAGGAPGNGNTAGSEGQESTFGAYSSADGQVYTNGYTDVVSGSSYARTGVDLPLPGSGDGGAGGAGGTPGVGYLKSYTYRPSGAAESVVNTKTELIVEQEGGPGSPGAAGGSGFVLLRWDRTEEVET